MKVLKLFIASVLVVAAFGRAQAQSVLRAVTYAPPGKYEDSMVTFTVHAALVPEIDTTGLSDITPDQERKAGYMDLLDKAHEKINIKVIGRTATDSGFYIFSKDPIRTLNDFKGVKIRSHSGYDPLFKAVGAVAVGT